MAFRDRIEAFVADAQAKAQDGFTFAELSQLFVAGTHLAIDEARQLQLPGANKKQYVLDALGYLFDAVAPAIPLGPLRFVSWIILPIVKQTMLVIADAVIELIYKNFPPPTPATS